MGGELVVESLPRGSSLPGGTNMCKEAIYFLLVGSLVNLTDLVLQLRKNKHYILVGK